VSQLGDQYFKGLVDEFTVYNRALSSYEVLAIYNAGSTGKCVPPAPPAPSNLLAQAVSPSQISLTWNQSFPVGATKTGIERKAGSGGADQEIAEINNSTCYFDTNLLAG